jgi:hypothetical protein
MLQDIAIGAALGVVWFLVLAPGWLLSLVIDCRF